MADDQFQYIKLPDGSYGKFAANASDDDIKGAISKDFPDAFSGQPPASASPSVNTGMGSMALHTPNQPAPQQHSDDVTDALQNSTISPPQPGITGAIDRFRGKLRTLMGADSKPAADVVGGMALGPVNVAHGLATMPSHPIRGANEVVSGVGQTVALPAAVVNPGFLGTAAPYAAGSSIFQQGAQNIGVDPDIAEFMGNVAMTGPAAKSLLKGKPISPPQPEIISPPKALPFAPADVTFAKKPIELGPSPLQPTPQTEGVFPAAPHFLVDRDGNPRIQFLTSATTDQIAAPNLSPESPQSVFQNVPTQNSSLLDGIREHELLSKTQDQLNGQTGDDEGQIFLQNWMESHNQQAPGAKRGPGLMTAKNSKTLNSSIEQANASGQSVLPPDDNAAPAPKSPGLINKSNKTRGIDLPPGEIIHPEDYPTIEEEEDYFRNFKSNLPEHGLVIEGQNPSKLPELPSGAEDKPDVKTAPQTGPGLMNKVKKQPQVATADNTEDLLRESLKARGIDPDAPQTRKGPGLMQNAQKEPAVSAPDQRVQYPDLRAEFDKLPPDEQVRGHFISSTTDLPNRKAFDAAENNGPAKAVAMSDADGLKAFNDKYGYEAGNALLKAKADALREAGIEAYHDKGDEFIYRGDSPEDLKTKPGSTIQPWRRTKSRDRRNST
jgi:hypothetical protein